MFRLAVFILASVLKACSAGTLSQEPRSVSVWAGDPVTLHCSLSGFSGAHGGCQRVSWFRAALDGPAGPLTPLGAPPGSAAEEERCALTLSRAAPGDTATYVCAYAGRSAIYVGRGSTVLVWDRPRSSPALTLLLPAEGAVGPEASRTVACMLYGVLPEHRARLRWDLAGAELTGLADWGSVTAGGQRTPFVRTWVRVPAWLWERGGDVTCVAEIEGGGTITRSARVGAGQPEKCPALVAGLSGVSVLLLAVAALRFQFWRRAGRAGQRAADTPRVSFMVPSDATENELHYSTVTFQERK
ncbi:uncharacterized protein [Lepisosteus oculatus]|uniref:uncharacterized protein isoform X2 n=1 Tax=Lepisosteus oculatus TaxID=7918 RepID=UPI00371261D9